MRFFLVSASLFFSVGVNTHGALAQTRGVAWCDALASVPNAPSVTSGWWCAASSGLSVGHFGPRGMLSQFNITSDTCHGSPPSTNDDLSVGEAVFVENLTYEGSAGLHLRTVASWLPDATIRGGGGTRLRISATVRSPRRQLLSINPRELTFECRQHLCEASDVAVEMFSGIPEIRIRRVSNASGSAQFGWQIVGLEGAVSREEENELVLTSPSRINIAYRSIPPRSLTGLRCQSSIHQIDPGGELNLQTGSQMLAGWEVANGAESVDLTALRFRYRRPTVGSVAPITLRFIRGASESPAVTVQIPARPAGGPEWIDVTVGEQLFWQIPVVPGNLRLQARTDTAAGLVGAISDVRGSVTVH